MTTTNDEETWETQEVINWLINDEGCYNYLLNKKTWKIRDFVRKDKGAPSDLYSSFRTTKGAMWRNVNWEQVAAALKEE